MKTRSLYFSLVIALLAWVGHSQGQEPMGAKPKKARTPEDYQARTLKDVGTHEGKGHNLGNKEETMVVISDLLPSRVRVTYEGSERLFLPVKKEVLRQWARLYAGAPEALTRPYHTELLFTEDRTNYWLAVREDSLPQIRQELRPGDLLDLFVIRVGKAKTSTEWQPVILVEGLQKAK